MNAAAGLYQMFGTLVDVLVLPPLSGAAAAAAKFTGAGALSALYDPSSFPDPAVADDGVLLPATPRASPALGNAAAHWAADAVIDAALRGAYFEELPESLPPLKVAGWSAQTAAALSLPPGTSPSSSATEWITLSLDFGGSVSHPDGRHTATSGGAPPDAAARNAGAAARKAAPPTGVLAEDPYSLHRGNTTFFTPEQSRFLHPVLRYYHSELSGGGGVGGSSSSDPVVPVLEHHIREDFNNDWTHFSGHVLSVARFLQDVGSRRTRAAAALANAVAAATAASDLPPASSKKQARLPSSLIKRTLAPIFHVDRTWGFHATTIRRIAHEPFANVHAFGTSVPGGEAWFHAFSIEALDVLLFSGPLTLMVHWRDTAPFPLTAAENATMAALVDGLSTGQSVSRSFNRATALSMQDPPGLTGADAAVQADRDAALRAWYAQQTASAPGSILLEVRARNGLGREQMASLSGELGLITVMDSRTGKTYAIPESVALARGREALVAAGASGGGSAGAGGDRKSTLGGGVGKKKRGAAVVG